MRMFSRVRKAERNGPSLRRAIPAALVLLAAAVAMGLPACEDDPVAPWLEAPPEFVTVIGTFGIQDGGFYYPSGITVDRDGNILVVDSFYPRMQTFAPDGTFLRRGELEDQSEPSYMTDVEVASDGTVFTATDRSGLHRFDAEGGLLDFLGSMGTALARDRSGSIWTTRMWSEELGPELTRRHPSIVRLDPDGAIADSVLLPTYLSGRAADPDSGGWSPWHLAVAPGGCFYAGGMDVIWFVTRDGERLETPFYSSQAREDRTGRTFHGMTVDEAGFLYIVDSAHSQVLKIDSQGRLVCIWGPEIPGQNPLRYPFDICIDDAGDLYVTDFFNHRVIKYSYSKAGRD